jgi:hypothetical protein
LGIVGKRKQNEDAVVVAGNGQRVWMENCVDCGCPITILAVTRPTDPRCIPCTQLAAAAASDD